MKSDVIEVLDTGNMTVGHTLYNDKIFDGVSFGGIKPKIVEIIDQHRVRVEYQEKGNE